MDWFAPLDNYCERTDPSYWSEPLNAVSNAAFLVAALVCWRMIGDRRDPGARILVVILAAIGVGSYLFHTHARRWALMADVIPIQVFILVYLYLATVRLFAAPWWAGLAAVALFIPFDVLAARGLAALVGPLNGSVSYGPVPILIAAYALALRNRAPAAARGLAIGAAVLVVSLFFRTIDAAVCPGLPLGTHFLWHLLNGLMLGWMIAVLIRHSPAAPTPADLANPGRRG
ncbi:ceramidase domain-containing protein [Amaricoccus sp.]|uniref:ceramidase domain-containing protein n=1 Tax=Amaricoccus sp. TaxID=1872485 RepID=UPI001B57880D|nr:ceramidase domain-containing protein [Amaricoccus sp.]MBP7240834.1 ceramidase domain-containing protein [Amaricoccus sp.]